MIYAGDFATEKVLAGAVLIVKSHVQLNRGASGQPDDVLTQVPDIHETPPRC